MSAHTYFQINEEQDNFLTHFILLSTKQQKIWNYLAWYGRNQRQVFPSHQHIADVVGCCRDTVIQAIKKFRSFGWLVSLKRCYRSCLYFINTLLLKLNTRDPNIFKKSVPVSLLKPTVNPTLVNVASYKYTNSMADDTKVFTKRERVHTPIPYCIQIKALNQSDRQILASNFSEYILVQAVDRMKWHTKKFGYPKKFVALLTYYCEKIKREE